MLKCITIVILLLGSAVNGFTQSSVENIRKLRENTMKDIEYANRILEETQGKTKESLREIDIINAKLRKRKEYIVSLEAETTLLNGSISDCESSIQHLESEMSRLKRVYESLVVRTYKKRGKNYLVIFFMASNNVSELYQRFRFFKIYINYIRSQRDKFERLRHEMVLKEEDLLRVKREKSNLVVATRKEYSVIQEESNSKKSLLSSLKMKQSEIEKEIREKERIARKLDNEIEKIIESERTKKGANYTYKNLTPAEMVISNDFGKNLGKLPWPTQRGIISGKYGEHEHPDFKAVKIRNDGIYITTEKGELVRSVFKGVVSRVFSIPGENYTVIIKHGNYYTLYHNMIEVCVKAGQHVDTRETIGKVFTDAETRESTLYFQIWKETERNDPELWLTH